MLWIDTRTDEEAIARSEGLWTPVATDHPDGSWSARVPGPEREDGRFWADAIADVKDDPRKRLEIARRHFPLPGAFREAAIALRALIRDARKREAEFESLLRELHHYAAISSWCLPYNEVAREPGFNVFERTPYARLAALDLGWDLVGCDALLLLNKTDRSIMRDAWGEPKAHRTANNLYRELWERGCQEVALYRARGRAELMREIEEIARGPRREAGTPRHARKRRSIWSAIFGRRD